MDIFPHISATVVKDSILHPTNQMDPFNKYLLLKCCVDDLLEGRTFMIGSSMSSDSRNTSLITEMRQTSSLGSSRPNSDMSIERK